MQKSILVLSREFNNITVFGITNEGKKVALYLKRQDVDFIWSQRAKGLILYYSITIYEKIIHKYRNGFSMGEIHNFDIACDFSNCIIQGEQIKCGAHLLGLIQKVGSYLDYRKLAKIQAEHTYKAIRLRSYLTDVNNIEKDFIIGMITEALIDFRMM